jgi:pentatricopeptide repeat protein
MEEEGLRPSSYTYSALLHGLGRAGYLDKAFDVLDKMKAQGMRPNVVTMSSLMDACGKHDQIDLALSLYREMLRADGAENKPNSITCSALVDSCLKAGQVERAFAIVQDMHARKLALTEVTYTSLITELTRLKQLDRIMDIVSPSEMKAKGNSISQNSRAAKSSNTQSGAVSTEKTMGSAAGSTGAVSRTGRVGHSTDVFPMSARTLSSTGGSDLQNRSDDASTVKASAPSAATGDVDMDYADMMEMFRGKHDHASVVAVYEGMKSNGVSPFAARDIYIKETIRREASTVDSRCLAFYALCSDDRI